MSGDGIHTVSEVYLAMQSLLVIWIYLSIVTIRRTLKAGSVGLPIAMLLTISFFYGGGFVYAIPGYTHLRIDGDINLKNYDFNEWEMVGASFISLLGVLGFSIGLRVYSSVKSVEKLSYSVPRSSKANSIIIFFGIVSFIGYVGQYLNLTFPMSQAIIETSRNIAVPFICLGAYHARRTGKGIKIWLLISILIPMYYFVVLGFMSYGFMYESAILAFWMTQLKKNEIGYFKTFFISCLILYVLLQGFVVWFSFRDEFRRLIWQGVNGSIFDTIIKALSEATLLTPWNNPALDMINLRLNLNLFIAKMLEWHGLHPYLKLSGSSLYIIPLVFIPRFIWSGKPGKGGSDFMREHTGIPLSEASSFGTGSVFEFYVNFGSVGVLVGFMILGFCIGWLDRRAAEELRLGNYFKFTQFYVIGVIAIDPLMRPFFIANGALMAWILMVMMQIIFLRRRPVII